MLAPLRKYTLALAVVLSTFSCLGQTNVYSLSVHTRWTIGSYPAKFGLEGYRKDAAGYYILAADGRSVGGQMAGRPKDYTAVIVGPVGFSVPFSPPSVVVFCIVVVSGFCLLAFAICHKLRRRGHERPTEP